MMEKMGENSLSVADWVEVIGRPERDFYIELLSAHAQDRHCHQMILTLSDLASYGAVTSSFIDSLDIDVIEVSLLG